MSNILVCLLIDACFQLSVLHILNFAVNQQYEELPDDQAYQMRMKTRSEVYHQGLKKYQKRVVLECSRSADTEPRKLCAAVWETFNAHGDDDMNEMIGRLDTLYVLYFVTLALNIKYGRKRILVIV